MPTYPTNLYVLSSGQSYSGPKADCLGLACPGSGSRSCSFLDLADWAIDAVGTLTRSYGSGTFWLSTSGSGIFEEFSAGSIPAGLMISSGVTWSPATGSSATVGSACWQDGVAPGGATCSQHSFSGGSLGGATMFSPATGVPGILEIISLGSGTIRWTRKSIGAKTVNYGCKTDSPPIAGFSSLIAATADLWSTSLSWVGDIACPGQTVQVLDGATGLLSLSDFVFQYLDGGGGHHEVTAPVISWDAGQATFRVPSGLPTGTVQLYATLLTTSPAGTLTVYLGQFTIPSICGPYIDGQRGGLLINGQTDGNIPPTLQGQRGGLLMGSAHNLPDASILSGARGGLYVGGGNGSGPNGTGTNGGGGSPMNQISGAACPDPLDAGVDSGGGTGCVPVLPMVI